MMPISDSPPPSRWKPGLKPWKPSYVRIQETKLKFSPALPGGAAPPSVQSDRPSERTPTRSPTRRNLSRSPSSGRSSYRSVSPGPYSRSASSSNSDPCHSVSLGTKSPRTRHKSNEDVQHEHAKPEIISCRSGSLSGSDPESMDTRHVLDTALPGLEESGDGQNPEPSQGVSEATAESGSDRTKPLPGGEPSTTQMATKVGAELSEMKKMKLWAQCWDSESDGELPGSRDAVPTPRKSSDREEGEASSEPAAEERPEQIVPPKRKAKKRKSKKSKRKHKRRNSERSGSLRENKKTKRANKKRQKPKETFHWQPPLEFGEEGEDDDVKDGETRSILLHEATNDVKPNLNIKQEETKDEGHVKTFIPEPPLIYIPPTNKNHDQTPTGPQSSETSPSVVTPAGEPSNAVPHLDTKWKPLKGSVLVHPVTTAPGPLTPCRPHEQTASKPPGLKIEIKSINRVRPGSLFDEVRKTARLNQRPRNQDSSSSGDEGSPGPTGEQVRSQDHSRSVSRSVSLPRSGSRSYTRSRSRSGRSSYSSRYRVTLLMWNIILKYLHISYFYILFMGLISLL